MNIDLKPDANYKKKLTTRGIVCLSGAGAFIFLLIAFVIYACTLPKDTIAYGVYANGISLGGMTQEQSESVLSECSFYQGRTISVTAEGQSASISPEEVSLSADIEATAQRAFGVGKDGNFFSNAFRCMSLKFKRYNVAPAANVNVERLDAFLHDFGVRINGELKQHEVVVENDVVQIVPGKSGQSENVEKARNDVLKHIDKNVLENIGVNLEKQTPGEFSASTFREFVHRDVQNAYYKVENNEIIVVPEVFGIDIDENEALAKASQVVEGGEPVQVQIIRTNPTVTADLLRANIFTGTLASYSTKYNAKKENRSHNVALAARKINGVVLAPGDEFSYNDVVGRRTVANGFLNAPVYENGKSVDGIGGGVCQVSTTLYSAALYADMGIVSRTNHSLPVSYAPLGQDATVADGAIDFKFKNTTDYPVKIAASAVNGTITVELIGTPVGNKSVKLHHSLVSDTAAGKTIASTKTVYENGVVVSEKSLGRSFYKKSEPSPSPTPSPSPVPTAVPEAPAPPLQPPISLDGTV
jgi:vancomycin resistance protein YoaR